MKTPMMSALADLVRQHGYHPTHVPDNDHCNEKLWWSTDGRFTELEISNGLVVVTEAGGPTKRFELATPSSLTNLSSHLRSL
jgi:hypothetical protein